MIALTLGGKGQWEGLEGLGRFELEALRHEAEKGVRRVLLLVVAGLRKTLTGPRHGRVYKITRTGRLHVASAPGEPPAVLYGRLRQSITATGPVWNGVEVTGDVGSDMVYARRLEFGGVDSRGVRILPRPYFEPTLQRLAPEIDYILEAAFEA